MAAYVGSHWALTCGAYTVQKKMGNASFCTLHISMGSPQICFGGNRNLSVNSREWSLLVKLSENEVTYQWKDGL